jgi:hypothetical protein
MAPVLADHVVDAAALHWLAELVVASLAGSEGRVRWL